MQLSEAQTIFAGEHLRFGDTRHIEAAGQLADLADCRRALRDCPHQRTGVIPGPDCIRCDGAGETGDEACGWCQGESIEYVLCSCICDFRRDIVEGAAAAVCPGMDFRRIRRALKFLEGQ